MGRIADRDGAVAGVDEIFDHPAFTSLKDRASAFVVVRPGTRDLIWANAAAAVFWDRTPETLSAALFGPPGRGWLGTATSAVVPGRAPQMFRTGLAPGLGMRGSMVLARAVAEADGATIVGVAVPGSGTEGAAPEAWRHCAGAEAAVRDRSAGSEAGEPPIGEGVQASEDQDGESSGTALSRRSQLAVLRDRLVAATDGAATLRFLWRTDPRGLLTQIDARLSERLGAPLAAGSEPLPDVVARFDPAAGERLGRAFAERATWSGLALCLPVARGAAIVPALISGSPVFGRDRGFEGFRGFGIVDLGALEATPRGAAPSAAGEPVPPAETEAPPAQHEPEPDAPAPASDRAAFANVVELRNFQAVRSAPSAPQEAPPLAAVTEADPAEAAGPAEPISDEMAFLALGAALRAQIGEAAPAADRTSEGLAAEAVASDAPADPVAAPAAPLLDRMPVPVLVLRDGAPVFANAAAARLLGLGSSDDLAEVASRLATDGTSSGPTLRDRRGEPVAVAGEPLPVDWAGMAATLWTFAPVPPEAPPSVATPRPDGEAHPVDLIDRVDDAVALLDGEGRIRRLNERGRSWFEAGAVGDGVTTLLAPESRPAALQLLEEARSRPEGSPAPPPRREVLARTRENAVMPALLTLGRLGAAGFYATLRDVSALRRAERDEARSRGERDRDAGRLPDLLARVSHEIRTPLNAILGFAEVMMDERFGPLGNPRYRDYLKDIHASGTQVVALVSDLLDLSRIEAGRLGLDVGAVDVNKIVAEIVVQMQPEANRGRVIVRTSLGSRIPAVMADERSARQIVQHLLSNAVKFNEPGGQVIVSTAQDEGGAVLLRIRDTGVGMTEAEIAAALEPFHDVSPPRPANGNGLGLPLARALVGANGASLSIRSRPREGTLVEVSFPPAPAEGARRGA